MWTLANGVSDTSTNALMQTDSDGNGIEYFDGTKGPTTITGSLTIGTWYFLGLSVNGSSAFAKYSADGSGSFTTVNISGLGSTTRHNFIMFGDSTFDNENFNGRIEAAKWWSTNLSEAEVEAEKPYRSPVRTSNVRAYWYFTASKTLDNSGNGLTLTESNTVDLEGSPTNLTDAPAQGTQLNAVYNPSFETDTSGWRGGSNFSIDRSTVVGGKDGTAALRIQGNANSTTVYNPSTDISGSTPTGQRDIAVGTKVKISFWLYIPAAQLSNVSAVGVVGTNEGITDAFGFQFVSPVGGGGLVADTWQQYEADATVTSVNFRSLQIQVWTNADVADGVTLAYIDAVSINDRIATDTYTDSSGLTDTSTVGLALQRTFNDSAGLTDNIAQSWTYGRTFTDASDLTDTRSLTVGLTRTDTTGLTDSSSQINGPAGPEATDSAGLTDSASVSQQKNLTDDTGLDDDVATQLTANRVPTDSAGLADSWGLSTTFARGVSEDAGLTDTTLRAVTFSRAFTDGADLSDSTTRSLLRPVDDLLGLSDEATRVLHKTVDDSVGLRDDADDQVTYNRFHDESVGLVDDPQRVATYDRSINELVSLVDEIEERLWHKTRDDYLPVVDTFITETIFNRGQSDNEDLADSFLTALTYNRTFTDSVGSTDTVTKLLSRLVQDDAGLTDSVDLNLYRLEVIQTDTVGLADQIDIARTRTFAKTDDTELADDVMLSLVSSRSIPDSVGLTDQAVVSLASSRTVVDSAGLTDSTLVSLVHTRTITDTLALTDTHQAPVVFNRPITDSTGLRDYPSYPAAVVYNRAFSDNAGVADQITFTRGLTFTDSVPLADNVSQARTWNRLFSDLVGVTDTFTRFASYTRSITDPVGLRDLPSVKVPTQEEWDFGFGALKKAWGFELAEKSWGFGDLSKAWRMTMADDVITVVAVNPEDFEVTVTPRDNGLPIDPTISDQVHFAFLPPDTSPTSGTTWVAGSWTIVPQPGDLPDLYKAIGNTGGLAAGRYSIWVRVTHGAKMPTDEVGTLIVL
jgi:hypothetical protein